MDFLTTVTQPNGKINSQDVMINHIDELIKFISSARNSEYINEYIDRSDNLEAVTAIGSKLIHLILKFSPIPNQKYLIEKKIDLEHEDKYGWRPIHFACQYSSLNIVEKLIDLGVNFHVETHLYLTPINILLNLNIDISRWKEWVSWALSKNLVNISDVSCRITGLIYFRPIVVLSSGLIYEYEGFRNINSRGYLSYLECPITRKNANRYGVSTLTEVLVEKYLLAHPEHLIYKWEKILMSSMEDYINLDDFTAIDINSFITDLSKLRSLFKRTNAKEIIKKAKFGLIPSKNKEIFIKLVKDICDKDDINYMISIYNL